jgi:glycosyltransferase involved in cell wall biosynthesis
MILLDKFKTVILIPHYNNLAGLKKTLKSVYHPEGICIIVIDDGSCEGMIPKISDINDFINKNVNVEIIYQEKNRGITEALNNGLVYALNNLKFEFIARLDCGDICVKNRFLLQEGFLNTNNEIDLVGSWVKFKNQKNEHLFSVTPPLRHKSILRKMSIRCSFIHPSVMYRRSVVEKYGLYPSKYEAAEDYAYFYSIVKKTKTANIPGYLTFVEMSENGISNKKRFVQNVSKIRVINNYSPKNFYYFVGMFFNLGLICTPKNAVIRTKRILFR